MTDKQLQYTYNARISRELVRRLEALTEEADFHEKLLNTHSHEIAVYEISEIKQQLDAIWSHQVDLFFDIRDEYSSIKTKVFMERIRPTSKWSHTSINQKDY